MSDPTSRSVTLRPDIAQYRRWVGHVDSRTLLLLAVIVSATVAGALISGSLARILLLPLLIVIGVVIGLGGALTSMRTSSVVLSTDTIEHRRWFVRRTELRVSDGLRGVLAGYTPPVSQKGSDLLVIQRADGKGPTIRLNGAFWSHEDLTRIALHAGVPVEDKRWRARHYEKRLPGIMRPWERHWIFFVLVLPVLAVVVLVAVLFVLQRQGWLPEPSVPDRTVAQQDAVRADLLGTIDLPWTTEAEVASCTDSDGSYRTASARARVPSGSAALDDPAAVVADLTAVLTRAGFTEVRPDIDDEGEFFLRARTEDADVKGPRVAVRSDDSYVYVEVVSRCETGG